MLAFWSIICATISYHPIGLSMNKKNIFAVICLNLCSLLFANTVGATDKATDKTITKTIPVAKKATTSESVLRIGSGSVGGNYFVLGALVGDAVSHPKGSLPCGSGGTCGIMNLNAQNITTAGSMDNLTKLLAGKIDSGFVQSDIAYWAYTGTGLFDNKEKEERIRAIASLYPEAIHIVVRKSANIHSVADLVNQRVSVGARKSGTIHSARLVLEAYKISEDDMQTEYLNNQQAIEKFNDGELDAMFFSVGTPAPALEQLFAGSQDFQLLSIGEKERQAIFKQGHYFSPYTIAAGTYSNVAEVKTISVYALWLTTKQANEAFIYNLTKALWDETAKQLFNSSHVGSYIDVENSLNGIGIPLHEGAKKYYNEIGKRF